MFEPVVHEALSVLARTAAGLCRDGGRTARTSRFVERTLRRWTAVLPASLGAEYVDVLEAVEGFDADAPDGRVARATRLAAAVEALRASAGQAPAQDLAPLATLVADGADRVMPRGAPDPAIAEASPTEPGGEVSAPQVGEPQPTQAKGEGPAGGRPSRRGRGRRGRDSAGRGADSTAAPGDTGAVEDAPAPAPVPREPAPEPPREVPRFPLGAPGHTGAALDALAVFTEAELAVLADAGMACIADLLVRAPRAVSRAGERYVDGVPPEGPVLVRGIAGRRVTRFRPGSRRSELRLRTPRVSFTCRWEGGFPPELAGLRAGADLGVVGRLSVEGEERVVLDAEPLGVDGRGGDWFPEYGIEGIADARVRAGVRAALRVHGEALFDHLPPEVIDRHKLVALPVAVRDVHFPSNQQRKGRGRMAFDELLQVQLGMALLRGRPAPVRGVAHAVQHALVARSAAQVRAPLSDAQESAFDTIRRDLRRSQPTERLLQGDVGSGTEDVALAAAMIVVAAKDQVFFVHADAQDAEHRFQFQLDAWRGVDVEPVLLAGKPTKAQADAIQRGDSLVVYGSRALLAEPPATRRLGLVIVEQSQGHGVPSMEAFDAAGTRPHLLVCTPTPLPAMLALTAYGQVPMTVVGPHQGRGVETVVLRPAERERAYFAARDAVRAGRQVIIAFPTGKTADMVTASDARAIAAAMAQDILPGARVAIFSSALTREERYRSYDDFVHRKVDVLLATTAFETAPPVPNAAVLVVENANLVDVVRLHRLRNHLVHGFVRGSAFLVEGEEVDAAQHAVLELIAAEADGTRVADLDMARRGEAAVLGEAAADVPRLQWADPAQDRETLTKARQEAFRILRLDPALDRRAHRALAAVVRLRFGGEALDEAATESAALAESASASAPARRRRRRRR